MENKKFLSVKEAAHKFNWPLGGLKGLLFRRKENGLSRAVVKVGRKVLLNITEFEDWIGSHSELKGSSKKY